MVVRELIDMLRTSAKLGDFGAMGDAYNLLDSIDSLAIALELDSEPLYVYARSALLHYLDNSYQEGLVFRSLVEEAMVLSEEGICDKAWQTLSKIAMITNTTYRLQMLHEVEQYVQHYCPCSVGLSSSSPEIGSR